MAHGHFIWNELNTHDPAAAMRFYAAIVGWTFDPMPMPNGATYWIITSAGERVGGIFPMVGPYFEGMRDHWFTYLDVDDVDRRANEVVAAGGSLKRPPMDIAGVGRFAVVLDSGGAGLALMTPVAPSA